MPSGFASGHGVIGAGQVRRSQRAAQGMRGHVGQQVGTRGRAHLVGHHAELLAFGSQFEHRSRKVAAAGRIDPTRAKDQMAAAAGTHALLADELGAAVHAQRAGGIVFLQGCSPLPSNT